MENKKGSLLTVFLIIAIILIGVMGVFMYMQKTEADRQIAELENNASKLQETINDLQGKIDTISNTINSNKTPEVDNTQDTTDTISDSKADEIAKDLFEKGSQKIRETEYTDYYQYESAQPVTEKTINGVTYQKRNVLYANVEKEYSEIFTGEALKNVLGKRFAEVDGYLYVSYGGATGWDVTNIKVSRVSGNNNEIEYTVTYNDVEIDDSITEQYSCKMTVKLVDGNYRISKINYCNIDKSL